MPYEQNGYLWVVDGGGFYSWEQVRHDAIEQGEVSGGQFGHIHVLHGQKQDLNNKTKHHLVLSYDGTTPNITLFKNWVEKKISPKQENKWFINKTTYGITWINLILEYIYMF